MNREEIEMHIKHRFLSQRTQKESGCVTPTSRKREMGRLCHAALPLQHNVIGDLNQISRFHQL
jgi:hypothetical protein